MQNNEVHYKHLPVQGLPRSLLQSDGSTVTIIALMQRYAGLNRERKREMQSEKKSNGLMSESDSGLISKTDRNILSFYLSAKDRWYSFWGVARKDIRQQSIIGTKAYAIAVDIQLLNAYANDWRNLSLEVAVLTESCPEWNNIQEAIERFWKTGGKEKMPLGVFMLWPRLVNDLQSWSTLNNDKQRRVGHAVFSLSSIGWTHWFIDRAISICPELESEFGELKIPSERGEESRIALEESRSSLDNESNIEGNPDESISNLTAAWKAIEEALVQIQGEWQISPSRAVLSRLITVGKDAAELLEAIPDDIEPPRSLFDRRLNILRDHLQELSCHTELSWLGTDDLNSIISRWDLALVGAPDDNSVLLLADDAELAIGRLAIALSEMQSSNARVNSAKQAVMALDEELSRPVSAILRIELTGRQLQVKEDVLAAERKQMDVMLFVMASASPMGVAFDPEVNYVAEIGAQSQFGLSVPDFPKNADQDAGEYFAKDDTQHVAVAKIFEQTEGELDLPHSLAMFKSGVTANTRDNENGPLSNFANIESQLTKRVENIESAIAINEDVNLTPSSDEKKNPRYMDFSIAAGEQCRPIWSLLGMDKPSLAYQFANALHEVFPHLHVPPPALLRSVALAAGLIADDGSLAISISEAYGGIDPAWFEPGDIPSNWHTALNLLLIAGTLRPMILAPAMGAAAIAGYRHLDGRYSSVLELVRLVSEVSEPLTGFALGPTLLLSAADEASQKTHLANVLKNAEDWLFERAPSKKIRYAPASKVWLHWLKPGEAIHKLILSVARGATSERNSIKIMVDELADYNAFLERVRDTDRRQLDRRGPDIEAGALEHLWIATCEAVALAKEWLAAESVLSESGGRLRTLVGRLQAAFNNHANRACEELDSSWEGDQWGLVEAASHMLRTEIRVIADMFRQSDAIPPAELHAKELLVRDLLLVPEVAISQDWVIESDDAKIIQSLDAWSQSPIDKICAFNARIKVGDLAGAGLLLPHLPDETDDQQQAIDRARDMWIKDLQREIQQARRASEVGLAYGYLSDAERAMYESELSAMELGQSEMNRFDQAMVRVKDVARKIGEQKARRILEAHREFEREKSGLSDEVAKQVEIPLAHSDIHTFNELMQRVRQGMEPWPERDLRRDMFREFFPALQSELLSQLARMELIDVPKVIKSGGSIGQLSFNLEGDEQARLDAEDIYRTWALSVGNRGMARENLRKILEALGMPPIPVRGLDQDRNGSGWSLQTSSIVDREVCPVPYFGSRAQGRYRVIVLTERLTPEDLLQRIGETSQQTATIVFVLSRSPARFWPELARLSKERQRSFLLLDESILLLLLAQRGSRLATWFDVALPFTYSDPYDASAGFVPPEMFYGRTSELEAVKAQGGCYFIYGGRQLGKTALLRRAEKIFHDPRADHYSVWIDLLAQGIGERRPSSDVWLSVFAKILELKIVDLDLSNVNPAKSSFIDTFLSSIKAFLAGKPGRRILLLLDEADHFFEQDARHDSAYAETRRLKQLMDETDRRFKVVFAGLHNVLRTANTSNQPLGHLNEAVRIGPLMNEREIRAAEDLITRPIEAAGFEFGERSLVMRILAQTNYYPSLIQLYCTQLLRHLRETKLKRSDVIDLRFKIYESDIESVFSGRPLRDAIRSKFRLTLQLDNRYEVIAYAIGLEALSPGYDHVQGIKWKKIRLDCATAWWPEGFATTSERDFLALLEEMVQLGVLSHAKTSERFSLRNPNVLLLLGSKDEIESTLQAEREPRIEFKSTIFRPTLGGQGDDPARNPLTYRQLDEVVQMRSSVSLVAASEASGIFNLLPGLRDQPGMVDGRLFVQLDRAIDKRSFVQELDKEIKKRVADGITVMLVAPTVPWSAEWVAAAQAKIKSLKSNTSFVSVVFVADPRRLWTLVSTTSGGEEWTEAWMTVLPWERGFVRKWLEELQFPTDAVDRLEVLTGFWGGLLESIARTKTGALGFTSNLDRTTKLLVDPEWRLQIRRQLTGGVAEAEVVLAALGGLGDGVSENDIVEYGDLSSDVVKRALLWAEPLGLIVRLPGSAWALDSFAKRVFGDINS